MSDIFTFAVGLTIFFTFVFVLVVVGGIKLARKRLHQPEFADAVDGDAVHEPLMTRVEY